MNLPQGCEPQPGGCGWDDCPAQGGEDAQQQSKGEASPERRSRPAPRQLPWTVTRALCVGAGQSGSGQCHTDASNPEGIGEVTQSVNITFEMMWKVVEAII